MWNKIKNSIEEEYGCLTANGYLNDVPKDDYMYEAWHNHCHSNPNSYHRNYRDDATVYINLVAISRLAHKRFDSYALKWIAELSNGLLR